MKPVKAALAVSASAAFLFFSCPLLAQAPVEDRSQRASGGSVATPSAPAQPDITARLMLELQGLRQELSYLRGTVEELQYQVEELEQQQQDNYQDLDDRVRQLYTGSAPVAAASSAAARPSSSGASAPAASARAAANGRSSSLYQQGFDALRLGERDKAITAFTQLVDEYPSSAEAPDALYWLGETYWLANRREDSRQAFVQLLEAHPNYRKSGDARYRLGIIYEQLGELDQATEYMQQAAQSDTAQAAAAKAWLANH